MKCINCNSEVADGTNFCPYCGSPMISQQQTQQSQYQPQQGQYQPQQGQYQPQQGQYQPQQGQYQPQQGQYQPQQGQYQPQQGQYQPQQGRYQPQQGQYQQSYQGQYQQGQSQYQQSYGQQKPQLPHRPQLTFLEAINIASQRIGDMEGRSRRSEYWWWCLAVGLGCTILYFIPYLGALSTLISFGLLFSATLRRLNDVPAPDWFGKVYLGIWGIGSILNVFYSLGIVYNVGFFEGFIYGFGRSSFEGIMAIILILEFVAGVAFLYYGTRDSNPEIDPMHGPSPKYTL